MQLISWSAAAYTKYHPELVNDKETVVDIFNTNVLQSLSAYISANTQKLSSLFAGGMSMVYKRHIDGMHGRKEEAFAKYADTNKNRYIGNTTVEYNVILDTMIRTYGGNFSNYSVALLERLAGELHIHCYDSLGNVVSPKLSTHCDYAEIANLDVANLQTFVYRETTKKIELLFTQHKELEIFVDVLEAAVRKDFIAGV